MIGQRLSHYRIVERIGAGGMGVVYRAHDEQLDRDVAIKVLPSGSLADESAHKQFRKEALSLARLNHPNIATVHEFGSQEASTSWSPNTSRASRWMRSSRADALPPAEVVRLGVQLAAGLAAAHQQGVVHRDLKPGNLRLTTDGRLKILDFGLAQLMPHASELGLTVTLHAIAGDQRHAALHVSRAIEWRGSGRAQRHLGGGRGALRNVDGQETIPAGSAGAADQRDSESDARAAKQAQSGGPGASERSDSEGAGARSGAAAIRLRANWRADLGEPIGTYGGGSHSAAARVARLDVFVAGGGSGDCDCGGYILCRTATTGQILRSNLSTSAVNRRRSVAVLGFKNLSGNPEKAWLSTAISEMLTTELSQGDQLRAIPGESVAQMKMSLALPDADSFSQQTLTRIRQNLGSDDVVMGSYLPLGNGLLRLDVRLQDAVAGETLASVSEKGNESEIDSLVSKAGAELRAKLGVGALSDAQSALVRASLPSNPEAARLYSLRPAEAASVRCACGS